MWTLPPAIQVFAPPKSGSSFLATYLPVLSSALWSCFVHTKRHRCSHTITIGCAPRWGGKARCAPRSSNTSTRRCSWASQAHFTARLPQSCCDALDPPNTSELLNDAPYPAAKPAAWPLEAHSEWWLGNKERVCTQGEEATTLLAARQWLEERPQQWLWTLSNSSTTSGQGRAHRLATALRSSGFVHGPSRLLPRVTSDKGATAPSALSSLWLPSQRLPDDARLSRLTTLGLPIYPGVRTGFATVIILHTRHPIEAMVSHYYCVALATVCPRRHASQGKMSSQGAVSSRALWNHSSTVTTRTVALHPSHETASSDPNHRERRGLEAFLRAELAGPAHTSLNRLLSRYERLAGLLEIASQEQQPAQSSVGARPQDVNVGRLSTRLVPLTQLCDLMRAPQRPRVSAAQSNDASVTASSADDNMWGCGRVNGMGGSEGLRSSVTMLLSRYEHMTTDFRGWTAKLLRALPSSVHCVARTQSSPFGHVHREADRAYLAKLERTLQAPFEDSFRPDGKHRHALTPGANLRKLSARALDELISAEPRVASLVRRLGYRPNSPWPV